MNGNKKLAVMLFVFALALSAFAADGSSLKPPAGARVAVVVFEDLQCASCAVAYPLVWDAAKAHNVPVVLHDFPLPAIHPWAMDAAVYARFFDTKSQKLGDDFRGFIYKSQMNINPQNLHQFVQKFADDNKVPLPFAIDPSGSLKQKVLDDQTLGRQIGLVHTPTIFVIGNGGAATPFVEVTDAAQLGRIIEDMQKKARAAPTPKPVQQRAHPRKKSP